MSYYQELSSHITLCYLFLILQPSMFLHYFSIECPIFSFIKLEIIIRYWDILGNQTCKLYKRLWPTRKGVDLPERERHGSRILTGMLKFRMSFLSHIRKVFDNFKAATIRSLPFEAIRKLSLQNYVSGMLTGSTFLEMIY